MLHCKITLKKKLEERLITAIKSNTDETSISRTKTTEKIGRKTNAWTFLTTNNENLIWEPWTRLRKRHLKRETQSFPIAPKTTP